MIRLRRAVALGALLGAACGRLDDVDVTRSATVTVPGSPARAPLPAGAFALDVAIGREALEAEGIDRNDIDAARLVRARIDVVSGSALEAWLDGVALHLEAPGLPRVLVAERRGIGALPAGTNAIDLQPSGVDLKPYVLASGSKVTAEATGTQPAETTTVRATATVRVDVSVTGLFH
jgi:hypothetical protein